MAATAATAMSGGSRVYRRPPGRRSLCLGPPLALRAASAVAFVFVLVRPAKFNRMWIAISGPAEARRTLFGRNALSPRAARLLSGSGGR